MRFSNLVLVLVLCFACSEKASVKSAKEVPAQKALVKKLPAKKKAKKEAYEVGAPKAASTGASMKTPPLKCAGSEPFWDLSYELPASKIKFAEMGFLPQAKVFDAHVTSKNGVFVLAAKDENFDIKMHAYKKRCTNTMHDGNASAYTADVVFNGRKMSGCCSVVDE